MVQGNYLSMLDDIDQKGQRLSDWEIEFVNSMLKKSDEDRQLTYADENKIEQIYNLLVV